MRVNVYAEEITDRIEIIEKKTADGTFTAVRFYLELPVTKQVLEMTHAGAVNRTVQVAGPFQHHPDDDDSAAVTFWGKQDIREMFRKAIEALDAHHIAKNLATMNQAETDRQARWNATNAPICTEDDGSYDPVYASQILPGSSVILPALAIRPTVDPRPERLVDPQGNEPSRLKRGDTAQLIMVPHTFRATAGGLHNYLNQECTLLSDFSNNRPPLARILFMDNSEFWASAEMLARVVRPTLPNTCLDYHDGKCHAMHHMCLQCPDRPSLDAHYNTQDTGHG